MNSMYKQNCHSRRSIISPFINIYDWTPSIQFVAMFVSSQVMKYTLANTAEVERRPPVLDCGAAQPATR